MVIFATVNLVGAVAELLYPEPEPRGYSVKPPVVPEGAIEFDAEQWEEQQEIQRRWAQRRFVLDLVRNVAMLLLACPLYVYHWRKIERAVGREDCP